MTDEERQTPHQGTEKDPGILRIPSGGLADLQEYQHGAGHSPPVHRTHQTYPEASGHGNHMTL